MDFEQNEKSKQYLERVRAFMNEHLYPNEAEMHRQHE